MCGEPSSAVLMDMDPIPSCRAHSIKVTYHQLPVMWSVALEGQISANVKLSLAKQVGEIAVSFGISFVRKSL